VLIERNEDQTDDEVFWSYAANVVFNFFTMDANFDTLDFDKPIYRYLVNYSDKIDEGLITDR
jgi:hypothetical protein